MKRIISILCILAMLLSAPVFAAGIPTLNAAGVTAQPGESVEIPISLADNADVGLTGMDMQVAYDRSLTATGSRTNRTMLGGATPPQDYTLNPLPFTWSTLDADYSEGELVTVLFTAPQTPGVYKIRITAQAFDNDLNEMAIETETTVTVPNVIGNVQLTGSVTTPVKNAEDASNLTGSGVTANVTWTPALENGRFAQNTAYTATVTVSPTQGASFANSVSITQLDGFSPFVKNVAGSYVATRTFDKTSDKDAPIAEAPTGLTATYGDTLGSVTLTNAAGNTAGSWTWKAGNAASAGNAGTRTHIAVFTPENTNDYATVERPVTVTVAKAPLSITAATVADKGYNGKTDDAKVTAVSFGGLVNGETLALDNDYTASGVYASADAGDSVAVTVTVALKSSAKASNYALSAATASATGKVSKAVTTLSISAKDAAYTGLTYDTTNITKTSNVETAPTYTYYADNNGAKGAALDGAPVNAGTYWVEGSIAATTNNSAAASQAVKFRITKAALTITAKDKTITYGEAPANDGVTYAGFVNRETEEVVSGLDYSYSYKQFGNVGTYTINPTGAAADNYQISLKPGKLTVEKKTVGLTWAGHTGLYYDGQAKAVTATATGLVNDDAVTVTVAGGAQKDVGSYTAKATGLTGAKAGNYKLPDDGLTQGYSISYALASVTATPATVTATVDQSTLTIKLVGYRGVEETVELTGLTIADGKVTVNGVSYTVDDSGVVVNESNATLTENPGQVEKPEDAAESITDTVVNEIDDAATGSEGLDNASAEFIFGQAAKDESIRTVEVSLSIQPKDLTEVSLKLEITPQVIYKDENGETKTETIPNSAIKAEVTVSVKLPTGMPTTGLVAKHSLGGGRFEFLKVTVAGGVASWKQSSFSEVELISDSRSATVNFTFENGSGQSVTYTAADIGKALPTDSKSGSSFLGWKIDGGTAAQTTLTDELLTALNGKTVAAEPMFQTVLLPVGPAPVKPAEPETPANPFEDVAESDYFYDAVLWAVKEGVTAGVSETSFAPGASCTRAQAVTFLWRAAGKPQATSAVNPFEDVSASDYYYEAVLWAAEQGITAGVSETSFAPDATVTRSQMMTFLWRAAGKPGADTANTFSDVPAGSYYADAVAWAVGKGVTVGTGAATFSPEDDCTRGQIVTFLYRGSK